MNFLKGLADKAKSAADALESPTKLGQGINQPSYTMISHWFQGRIQECDWGEGA